MIQISQKTQLFLLLLIATILFTVNIGSYPFIDGDATFYGQVAKNMLTHGDWFVLRFDHFSATDYVDKPPLTMWAMAIMFKLLGPTEFAGRLWHSLIAVLTVWMTYLIGCRLFKHKVGILSGFILTTSLQFFYQAREPLQDIPLAFCFVVTIYLFILFIQRQRWCYVYLIAVILGMAVMIKGPVGVVVPGLIISLVFVVIGAYKRHEIKDYLIHIPLALGVFLLICFPWHLWAYLRDGSDFLVFYFGKRTFSRYAAGAIFPGTAIPVYLGYLVLACLPWTPFLVPASYQAGKMSFLSQNQKEKEANILLLTWIAVVFLFFAISPGNIFMRYLLPLLPATALIMGNYLYNYYKNKNILSATFAIIIGLLLLGIIISLNLLFPSFKELYSDPKNHIYLMILTPFITIFSVGILLTGIRLIKYQDKWNIVLLVSFTVVAYGVFIQSLTLHIDKVLQHKKIADYINQQSLPETKIAKYMPRGGYTMLSFYLNPYLKKLRKKTELDNFLRSNDNAMIIVEDPSLIPDDYRSLLKPLKQYGEWTLLQKSYIPNSGK